MRSSRNRSFRPEISGLEGRQLLSAAAGHVATHAHAAAHIAPTHAGLTPTIESQPAAAATSSPQVSTFYPGSLSAPALAQFQGKTFIAWSSFQSGTLHVGTIVQCGSGYELTSQVTLHGDHSPYLSPALAVFQGRLYLAWTDTEWKVDLISSADGVHFTSPATTHWNAGYAWSNAGPSLAAVGDKLYISWADTNDKVSDYWSTDGTTFGNSLHWTQLLSCIDVGNQRMALTPAITSFRRASLHRFYGAESSN